MREEGVLKLSHLYMFSRQPTNGTFAAPTVSEIYTANKGVATLRQEEAIASS